MVLICDHSNVADVKWPSSLVTSPVQAVHLWIEHCPRNKMNLISGLKRLPRFEYRFLRTLSIPKCLIDCLSIPNFLFMDLSTGHCQRHFLLWVWTCSVVYNHIHDNTVHLHDNTVYIHDMLATQPYPWHVSNTVLTDISPRSYILPPLAIGSHSTTHAWNAIPDNGNWQIFKNTFAVNRLSTNLTYSLSIPN